jgi:hypothetical protein
MDPHVGIRPGGARIPQDSTVSGDDLPNVRVRIFTFENGARHSPISHGIGENRRLFKPIQETADENGDQSDSSDYVLDSEVPTATHNVARLKDGT